MIARSLALAVFNLLLIVLPLAADALTAEEWREDLAVLDDAIRTDHESPFHTISEADYTDMVASLHAEIPDLADQAVIVRMASIIAAVNDGHTRLTGWHRNPDWGFRSYPVALYWFSDGLFVRQAHTDYADLVGARVVRIGKLSAEEAQARIEQVVAADNQYGEVDEGPYYLNSPDVMRVLGILENAEDPPYVLEKDGQSWTPDIEPLSGDWPGWTRGFVSSGQGWVDSADPAATPTPLWRRHVDRTFWFEYLADEKTLYVQENQVRNDPAETQEQFYARVWQAFQDNDVEKFVLDLRLNGGGNNYLNKPALTMMVRADATAQTFTIIGRQTFSACQNLVNELSKWTDTVFVGEPTGERVNFYGDTRPTELPHSGLTARVSWLWWQNLDPRDTRDAMYPDLAADLSSTDYTANHDPAMQVIRQFEGLMDADGILAMLETEGLDAVSARLREAAKDPAYRHQSIEAEINAAGYRLLSRDQIDDAVEIFQLNVEMFPESWNAWDSLGDAYEASGQLDVALRHFRKSLKINPESPTGLAAVARLEGRVTQSSALDQ